jgi:hypothetical protein
LELLPVNSHPTGDAATPGSLPPPEYIGVLVNVALFPAYRKHNKDGSFDISLIMFLLLVRTGLII